jgi:membrane protease subunit HflC
MNVNRIGFILAGVLIALLLVRASLFVVDQRPFAVLYALGAITEVVVQPGL